jgi:hypothetical protein
MIFDILKNPIIIGILVGISAYLYLKWAKKPKKNKKNKQNKYKPNIIIPLTLGIIAGLGVWYYFSYTSNQSTVIKPEKTMTVETLAKEPLKVDVIDSLTGQSNNSVSYHLVGKGINFPNNLPDVFLDMDGFD